MWNSQAVCSCKCATQLLHMLYWLCLCYLQMIILLSDWREQINCGYLIVLCLLRQAKRNSLINSQEPVRDKLEPVVFFLNFSLYEPIPRARRAPQNLDFFPILSPEQKSSRRTEVWSLACTSFTGFLFSNLEMVKKWYGPVSPCKIWYDVAYSISCRFTFKRRVAQTTNVPVTCN